MRDARLLTLIQAYPGFRESIALYSGMWPEFVNRVNERREHIMFDRVANPAYRHIDDPNLLTLLLDLGVLAYREETGRYCLVSEWEQRTTDELGLLLNAGF